MNDDKLLDPPLERCPERISVECYQGDCDSCDWDGPDACLCEHHVELSQIQCSWCSGIIRSGGLPLSHGICKLCAIKWVRDLAQVILIIPYFLL